MIARNNGGNFFTEHYDWLAFFACLVVLALAAAYFVLGGETDPDEAAAEAVSSADRSARRETGVKPADLGDFHDTVKVAKMKPQLGEITGNNGNFLTSECRVYCEVAECHAPCPVDPKAFEKGTLVVKECPVCHHVVPTNVVAAANVRRDTDEDGMPDDWELHYKLNPKDAADAAQDSDGDGFTNLEEYGAKVEGKRTWAGTDPTDAKDHPDYFPAFELTLPLKKTVLPFHFEKAMKLPSGHRLYFKDPKRKNDYGKPGTTYAVLVGEKIGDTGYVAKGYEQKVKKVAIKGSNVTREVDASVATIERTEDRKEIALAVGERNKPVDVVAKIVFNRGTPREFSVVRGSTIGVFDCTNVVTEIRVTAKGAEVDLKEVRTGRKHTLSALER